MKKKNLLACAAGLSVLTAAALLPSCDKPAPGLGQTAVTESVYGSEPATGSSAPSTEGAKPAEAPKTVTTPPKPVEPPKTTASTPPPVKPEEVKTTPPPPPPPAPAPAAVTTSGPKITVKPEMPKPLFAGTPLNDPNPPPNLDKSNKPTLEVTVPEGVTLLSKGKPVTSSDPAPVGELSLITDGEKQGDDGYAVELLPLKQWVQIDLGASREIHLVWLWHFHKTAVIYKDVIVQISDDPEFKTATTVYNNDFDNSYGLGVGTDQSWIETNNGRALPVKGVKGRYVRLHSNGRNIDDTNQYIEVEVYGK